MQAVRINVLATLAAAPVLLGLAWWGLPWVMGEVYAASLWPLAALLPGVAAYAAASSLSAFYTNHLGRPQLSGAIAGLSLLVSFGLGWLLVPRWGAVAGAGLVAAVPDPFAVTGGVPGAAQSALARQGGRARARIGDNRDLARFTTLSCPRPLSPYPCRS